VFTKIAAFSGLLAGAGHNINKHNSIIGEFMWSGLPPGLSVLRSIDAPFRNVNLYTLTANYRRSINKIGGSPFGAYLIGGGGWYYPYTSVDKNYFVPPGTTCQPIYT
jgi:hypothetical protein